MEYRSFYRYYIAERGYSVIFAKLIETTPNGYRLRPAINEEEAGIVRLIFRLFLEGRTPTGICKILQENASAVLARDEYARKYNGLVARYEQAMEKVKALQEEKDRRQARDRELRVFIDLLQTAPLILDEWDIQMWNMLLERATVYRDGRIEFEFKNGMREVVQAEEK